MGRAGRLRGKRVAGPVVMGAEAWPGTHLARTAPNGVALRHDPERRALVAAPRIAAEGDGSVGMRSGAMRGGPAVRAAAEWAGR